LTLLPPIMPPFNYSRPIPPNGPLRGQDVSTSSRSRSPYSSSPGQSSQNRGHSNRHHHQSLSFTPGASAPNLQPHYRSLLDVGSDQHTRTSSSTSRPLPPVPRLDEDDICPVCHRALPSRAYPDSEDRRAAHITQCIDEQLAIHGGHASRPGAYTSQSQPVSSSTAPEASDGPSQQQQPPIPPTNTRPSPPPPLSTPESRAAAREAAHASVVLGYNNSHGSPSSSPVRRTGMFLYLASEKDCVDDAECTICLEEFIVGAQMARLECFCRFHRKCIGDWFVDHPGRCPVHSHDGFGF
jgi:Ring finger domain